MTDLSIQFPDDFKMCERCVGQGTTQCSSCAGQGRRYDTRYDRDYEGRLIARTDWVSCISCDGTGYVKCASCGGNRSIRKPQTRSSRHQWEAETEEPFDSYEPIKEEETESQLYEEMFQSREEILDDISKCKRDGLSSHFATNWSERLADIDPTSPEAEAELKTLEAGVKSYREECIGTTDQDWKGELTVMKLSDIESSLSSLSRQSYRYQSLFSSQKPQPAPEPVPEEKSSLREEIERLVKANNAETLVECPGCSVKMKAKNLQLHYDKHHWWQES